MPTAHANGVDDGRLAPRGPGEPATSTGWRAGWLEGACALGDMGAQLLVEHGGSRVVVEALDTCYVAAGVLVCGEQEMELPVDEVVVVAYRQGRGDDWYPVEGTPYTQLPDAGRSRVTRPPREALQSRRGSGLGDERRAPRGRAGAARELGVDQLAESWPTAVRRRC